MINQKKIETLEKAYIIMMISFSLLYYIPFLMSYIDYFLDISIILGILLIISKLYFKRINFDIFSILLFIFLFSYTITIFSNGMIFNDFKIFIYLALSVYIFFDSKDKHLFKNVNNVIIFFSFITGILSILMLVFKVLLVFHLPLTTDLGIMGVHPNHSLYGFIGNSNRMCWISIMGIASSLLLIKNKKFNFICKFNIVLQFILIILSNSRGGIIGGIAFVLIYTFLLSFKKYNLIKSFIISLAILIISVGSINTVKILEGNLLGDITPKIKYEFHLKDISFFSSINAEEVGRSDEEMQRTSSARIEAYKAGISIFINNPLFGVGKENIANHINNYLPEESLLRGYNITTNLHSIYITILASSGLFGFIPLSVFFIVFIFRVLKYIPRLTNQDFIKISFVISFLIINLFETEILYTRTFSCFIFWLYIGNINNELTDSNESRLNKMFVINLVAPIYKHIRLCKFRYHWKKINDHNHTHVNNVFDSNKVKIGKATYGNLNIFTFNNDEEFLYIGNYCSIANNVQFMLSGEHSYTNVSTFPFKKHLFNKDEITQCKGKIIVGDDVWIGNNVIVLSGIKIGQGAIVAAGTVVSKDVPPYAILTNRGVVKYRFQESIINVLSELDYDGLSYEIIKTNMSFLYEKIETTEKALEIVECLNKQDCQK